MAQIDENVTLKSTWVPALKHTCGHSFEVKDFRKVVPEVCAGCGEVHPVFTQTAGRYVSTLSGNWYGCIRNRRFEVR